MDRSAKLKYLAAIRQLEERRNSEVDCHPSSEARRDPTIEMRPAGGHPWLTPLDYACEQKPVLGRSGKVLVQTKSRTLYLFSKEGKILWTHSAACTFRDLTLLADDTAVGLCNENKVLVGIRGGQQVFSITSKPDLSPPLAEDKDGNFYRFSATEIFDRHQLIKSNGRGQDLWTMAFRLPITPKLAMSPDGKIYLLNRFRDGELLILGDQAQ